MIGYAKSRHAGAAVLGMVVALGVALAVHDVDVELYFDPDGSTVRVGLLTPVLLAIAWDLTLGVPLGEMEAVFGRGLRRLRGCHVVCGGTILALGAATYGTVHGWGGPWSQFARNSMLLVGVLLVAVVVIGSDHAWIVPVGLALGTYAFGVDYAFAQPRAWALLFHEAGSASLLSSLAFALAAGALFVLRGPHGAAASQGDG